MNTTKEMQIIQTLKELGISPRLIGYGYLKYALHLVAKDRSWLKGITYRLYPEVARAFGSTPTRVERGIRHAIGTGWTRGNVDFAYEVFRFSIDPESCKPTNAEFLHTVTEYLDSLQ